MRRRNARSHALAALLVGLVGQGPVQARPTEMLGHTVAGAKPPRLAVLTVALDNDAQAAMGRLNYLAEQVVQRSGRFELVRMVDELDPKGWDNRQKQVSTAEEAFAAGQRAYDELDTQRASRDFSEAIKAFKQTDLTRQFPAMSKSWVMRIAALVANGETRAANNEIDRLLAQDPGANFSPNYFPPDSLKQVEDARRAALAGGRGVLEVKTRPSGAQVFVNGKFRGISPLKLEKLPAGEHWLSLVAPGYALMQQPATWGRNELTLQPAEFHGQWKQAVDAVTRDPQGPGRDAAAKALGQWLKAQQMVLAVGRTGAQGKLEVTLFRMDTSDGHNWAHRTATLERNEALVEEGERVLTALLAEDQSRRGNKPLTHFVSRTPAPTSDHRQTVGFVLLGSAAAMLAGGAILGAVASNQNAQFRVTPQTSPESMRLKQSGQGFALAADIMVLGGLLATAPGGYFAFWSGSSPAPSPTDRGHKAHADDRPARDDELREW